MDLKTLRYPDCMIDLEARSVTRDGVEATLTVREVELLGYLSTRTGEVVSQRTLEKDVWEFRAGVRSKAVPVAIRRLREKVEADPSTPEILYTVKGRGWVLLAPPEHKPRTLRRFHTPWISRGALQETVLAALKDFRVVTLVGPGGAGKTRLATEVLAGKEAVMVDLCRIEDPRSVIQQMLTDTGLDGRETDDLGETLDRHLEVVLVDNAEHVIEGVAELIAEFADITERVRFLVTSRSPLRLPFERVVEVGAMESGDAEALFDAHFGQVGTDRAVVSRLVEMVDRLPLAIELVARRRVPLDVLVAHVEGGAALRSGNRGLTPRETSMDGAIRWSWDLLEDGAKEVMRICALWPGTAPIAGVTAVAGRDVMADLEVLFDGSMLQQGVNSVRMLRLVRGFVHAESEPDSGVRTLWRTWMLENAERLAELRQCEMKYERQFTELSDELTLVAGDPEASLDEEGRALLLLTQVFVSERLGAPWLAKLLALRPELPVHLQHAATVAAAVFNFNRCRWEALATVADEDVSKAPPRYRLQHLHVQVAVLSRESRFEEALVLAEQALAMPEVRHTPRWYLSFVTKCLIEHDLGVGDPMLALENAGAEAASRGWPRVSVSLEMARLDLLSFHGRVREAAALGQLMLQEARRHHLDWTYEYLAALTATALSEFDLEEALETVLVARAALEKSRNWSWDRSVLVTVECIVQLLRGDAQGCLEAGAMLGDRGHNLSHTRLAEGFVVAAKAVKTGDFDALQAVDPIELSLRLAGAAPEVEGPAIVARLEALARLLRGEEPPAYAPSHTGASQFLRALDWAIVCQRDESRPPRGEVES